jgi:hypothetical protein
MTLSPIGYKCFAEVVWLSDRLLNDSLCVRGKINTVIRNERNRHRVPLDKGLQETRCFHET